MPISSAVTTKALVSHYRTRWSVGPEYADDSSSLLPIAAEQERIFPGTAEAAVAHIEMRRLEDVIKQEAIIAPALLKPDVQGYELQALRGCASLLDAFAWVYCECSFVELYAGQALADEVIAWLRARGFGLVGAYNMANDHDGRAVQADFLFGRTGRSPKPGCGTGIKSPCHQEASKTPCASS
ncbi:FkbM family methyltransferase [Metallibacterium sp.]